MITAVSPQISEPTEKSNRRQTINFSTFKDELKNIDLIQAPNELCALNTILYLIWFYSYSHKDYMNTEGLVD